MPRISAAAKAARDQIPQYRILAGAGAFLEDETLHEQGEIIEYLGTPNPDMEPLNEAAEARMREYIEELDDGAREKARLENRPFRGRMRDLAEQVGDAVASRPKEQSVVLPKNNLEAPVRPDMVPIAKRRRADADKVVSAKKPAKPTKATPVPIALQGTHYTADAASESGLG